jgi:hypothetical protein
VAFDQAAKHVPVSITAGAGDRRRDLQRLGAVAADQLAGFDANRARRIVSLGGL